MTRPDKCPKCEEGYDLLVDSRYPVDREFLRSELEGSLCVNQRGEYTADVFVHQ